MTGYPVSMHPNLAYLAFIHSIVLEALPLVK